MNGTGPSVHQVDVARRVDSHRCDLAQRVRGGGGTRGSLHGAVLSQSKERLAVGSPDGSVRAGLHLEEPAGRTAVVIAGNQLPAHASVRTHPDEGNRRTEVLDDEASVDVARDA